MNKKLMYNKIMEKVSIEVKKVLNENAYSFDNPGSYELSNEDYEIVADTIKRLIESGKTEGSVEIELNSSWLGYNIDWMYDEVLNQINVISAYDTWCDRDGGDDSNDIDVDEDLLNSYFKN